MLSSKIQLNARLCACFLRKMQCKDFQTKQKKLSNSCHHNFLKQYQQKCSGGLKERRALVVSFFVNYTVIQGMMKRENLKVIGFSTIKTSFIYINCFEMLFLINSFNFQDSKFFY